MYKKRNVQNLKTFLLYVCLPPKTLKTEYVIYMETGLPVVRSHGYNMEIVYLFL